MIWLGIVIVCVLLVVGAVKLKRRWQSRRDRLEREAIEANTKFTALPTDAGLTNDVGNTSNGVVETVNVLMPGRPIESPIESPVGERIATSTEQATEAIASEGTGSTRSPESTETDRTTDYQYLENLLAEQRYEEADRVTWRILLQLMGAEKDGFLEFDQWEDLSAAELQKLDALWLRYSQGRWGFSVQRRLFQQADGDYSQLGRVVGWTKAGVWLEPTDAVYDLKRSLPGHLPQEVWRNTFTMFYAFGLSLVVEAFLSHPAFASELEAIDDAAQPESEVSDRSDAGESANDD